MELLTAVIPWILDRSVAPIQRHISYAFGFGRKVNTLHDEVRKLEIETNSLQSSIVGAQSRGEVVEAYVLEWQTRADDALEEAKSVIRIGEEEAQRSCSLVLCLNLKTRYRIGKKAVEGTPVIVQLLEAKGRFGPISRLPSLKQIVRPPVQGYEAHSRTKILKEVMQVLLDPNINMVGVYGMGGIGKTTLVEEVHRQATLNNLFDKVVIARVTATPELRRIQDEIAEFVIGSKLHESSDSARASRLHQSLRDRRVLIILDDLWSEIELDKVGIPINDYSKGCKILLTSRSLDLLSNKMGSQKNFSIQVLSKEELMSLFEKKVAEIKDREIAEKILVKCDGFPLMIVTVAGLLRDKELHVWNDILTGLSKFDHQEIKKKVYSVLELSYYHLPDDEIKGIFLLCGICSQSNTTLPHLLSYGLGLGLFRHLTVSEAKDHLKTLIDHLKSCSLLDVNNWGILTMHDTVRDAAITIARRDHRAFRTKDDNVLKEWPSKDELSNCTKVSLPYSDIQQFPEELGCPEVEFLLFFSKRDASFHIPDSTFQRTKQLKVIHFTRMRIASIPQLLCFLTNLRTLCLEHCHLPNVAAIGQLKNLEVLCFHRSSLEVLPIEIGQLTNLKLLDLSYCSKFCYISKNVISKLTSLEELLMRNSFDSWEIEEHSSGSNARLSELKCLPRLVSLEICVPNAKSLPKDLFSNRLRRYQILIGEGWQFEKHSKATKILKLNINTSSDVLQQVRELLKDSEDLSLAQTNMFTNLFYENNGFPKLKRLCIENSPDLQYIVDCGKRVGIICFPLLESLELLELKNLVLICHGQPRPEAFGKIKRLIISDCNRLKFLLSVSMVQSISQLEEISVYDYSGLEALFVEESGCSYKGNEAVEFPQLQSLHLYRLPQLECFFSATESLHGSDRSSETTTPDKLRPFFSKKVALPRLEKLILNSVGSIQNIWCNQLTPCTFNKLKSLSIYECDKLRKAFPSDALGNFQNLESIYISTCDGLGNLMQPVLARSLSQLSRLEVWGCGELEEIVAPEECSDNLPCLLFPQLESLTLGDLPKLISLFPGSHNFSWPNFKKLTFRNCNRARIFGSFSEPESSQRVGRPHFPNQPQHFFSPEKVFPNLEKISLDGRISKSLSGSWLKYLMQLKSLELDSVEGKSIVASDEFESIPNLRKLDVSNSHIKQLWRYKKSGFDQTDASINFPQPSLRVLRLININGLKHVWRRGSQMDPCLPYLEILQLRRCGDLISLATSPSASFRCLSTLELRSCNKVTELIKPSTATTMSNLVSLTIKYCNALKEVVAVEKQQDGDHLVARDECIIFNKLKSLDLQNLESFEAFCTSSCHSFNFPCLEDVSVYDCPSMRIFCNGDIINPKLHNINGKFDYEQQCEGDLNTTIRILYESLQAKPHNISRLRVSRFLQLVERWGRELPFKLSSWLKTLVVDKFALLPIAVPSNILPSLSGLYILIVEKCDSVEEIFDLDGMDQNEGQVGLMSQLQILKLIELPKLRHVWNEDPLRILGFKYIRQLKIYNCSNLTHIFDLSIALDLVHLNRLEVKECSLVEVIIKQEGDVKPAEWDHHTLFPSLKSIELENLPSLTGFNSSGDVMRCPDLNKVSVLCCPQACLFGSIYSSKEQDGNIMVHRSHDDRRVDKPTLCIFNNQVEIFNLEELGVQWNSGMDKAWYEIVPEPFLYRLQVIKLMGFPTVNELVPLDFVQGMPKLQRFIVNDSSCKQILSFGPKFFREKQPVCSFAKLKYLELFNLPELEYLVKEDSQLGLLFDHLEILQVSKCNRLTWLVTSFTAKGLVNLKKMVVKECERMTEIVSSNKDEVGEEIIFEQLSSLKLHGLPCLTCFSSRNYMFDFPLLDKVIIRKCPNMKTFAKNVLSTPLLDEVQVAADEDAWHWEHGLNSTIEKLFTEMLLDED